MGIWKLANSKEVSGLLDKTDRFTGVSAELKATLISIPTEMDIKKALNNIGGIISAGIRSLEIWWDSEEQKLDIILVASIHDLDKFKQSVYNMYPNIDFLRLSVSKPTLKKQPFHPTCLHTELELTRNKVSDK